MKAHILVIDDDAVACEFLQEALALDGYEVKAYHISQRSFEARPFPL